MKRYSTPLVIKEMQSKTTMKYFIFTKEDSYTQRKQKLTSVGEEVEKQGPRTRLEGRQAAVATVYRLGRSSKSETQDYHIIQHSCF